MTSVFIGGSRKLSRLNAAIRGRVDNIIDGSFTVLLGDANGTDKAVQKYLAEKNYRNVVVFCMEGVCRNNIGDWEARSVPGSGRRRDFQYYATKDVEMAKEASYGFMLWDGRSKGTLNNMLNLLKRNKKVLIYFAPERQFLTLRNPQDLANLLKKCDEEVVRTLQERLRIGELLAPEQATLNLG